MELHLPAKVHDMNNVETPNFQIHYYIQRSCQVTVQYCTEAVPKNEA